MVLSTALVHSGTLMKVWNDGLIYWIVDKLPLPSTCKVGPIAHDLPAELLLFFCSITCWDNAELQGCKEVIRKIVGCTSPLFPSPPPLYLPPQAFLWHCWQVATISFRCRGKTANASPHSMHVGVLIVGVLFFCMLQLCRGCDLDWGCSREVGLLTPCCFSAEN